MKFALRFRNGASRAGRRSKSAEDVPQTMRMSAAVHRQILGAIGTKAPENGMVLGGDPTDGVVRHVVFDDGAERSSTTYSPDHNRLNSLLTDWWLPSGIRLLGFVHSHPGEYARPSVGDLRYAEVILTANPHLKRLLMPIVTVLPEPVIHPFVVLRATEGVIAVPAVLDVLDEVLVPAPAKLSQVAGTAANPRRDFPARCRCLRSAAPEALPCRCCRRRRSSRLRRRPREGGRLRVCRRRS